MACRYSNPTLGTGGFSCAVSCFSQVGLNSYPRGKLRRSCLQLLAEDVSACRRRTSSSHARKNLWYPGYSNPALSPHPLPRGFLFRPRFSFLATESLTLLTTKKNGTKIPPATQAIESGPFMKSYRPSFSHSLNLFWMYHSCASSRAYFMPSV